MSILGLADYWLELGTRKRLKAEGPRHLQAAQYPKLDGCWRRIYPFNCDSRKVVRVAHKCENVASQITREVAHQVLISWEVV